MICTEPTKSCSSSEGPIFHPSAIQRKTHNTSNATALLLIKPAVKKENFIPCSTTVTGQTLRREEFNFEEEIFSQCYEVIEYYQ